MMPPSGFKHRMQKLLSWLKDGMDYSIKIFSAQAYNKKDSLNGRRCPPFVMFSQTCHKIFLRIYAEFNIEAYSSRPSTIPAFIERKLL
jgi:hypothetical protein